MCKAHSNEQIRLVSIMFEPSIQISRVWFKIELWNVFVLSCIQHIGWSNVDWQTAYAGHPILGQVSCIPKNLIILLSLQAWWKPAVFYLFGNTVKNK